MDEYRKQGYLLENFRLFHLSSPGGTRTEFHYHEFCKVLFLIEGSGGYTVDGQRYSLRSGDVVLIPSGCIHRPELDGEAPYHRVILYISPEYLRRASTEESDLMTLFSGEKGHVLRLGDKGRSRLTALVETLEKDLAAGGFGRDILSQAGLLRLLVELRRRQETEESPDGQTTRDPRIQKILSYIDSNLSEELDIDTIAQQFFLSKYHMMRLFRQETGSTIHLYITQRRLMQARELIQGGMKATQACYQSGFRSYSAFTRACEKHLGTTPTGKVGQALQQEEGAE